MSDSDARKYVIVGNGFAGTTCAEQLSKHEPSCEILLATSRTRYTIASRCRRCCAIKPEAKVMIRNLAWHEENRIDLHLRTRVGKVVPQEKYAAEGPTANVTRTTRC